MIPYSVVIPAFNAEETIVEALESVLRQTIRAEEIIVVDDGSTDKTATIVSSFDPSIRIIKQNNTGPGAATSRGIKASGSPIVALLDADDIWLPHKIERQLQVLESEAGIHVVACKQRQFHHGRPDDGSGKVRSGMNRSGIVFFRRLFEEVGDIIDPVGNRGDMVDWLARVRLAGYQIHEIDELLSLRRVIPGSMSYGRDPGKDLGYLKVAHEALKRRRDKNNGTPV